MWNIYNAQFFCTFFTQFYCSACWREKNCSVLCIFFLYFLWVIISAIFHLCVCTVFEPLECSSILDRSLATFGGPALLGCILLWHHILLSSIYQVPHFWYFSRAYELCLFIIWNILKNQERKLLNTLKNRRFQFPFSVNVLYVCHCHSRTNAPRCPPFFFRNAKLFSIFFLVELLCLCFTFFDNRMVANAMTSICYIFTPLVFSQLFVSLEELLTSGVVGGLQKRVGIGCQKRDYFWHRWTEPPDHRHKPWTWPQGALAKPWNAGARSTGPCWLFLTCLFLCWFFSSVFFCCFDKCRQW